MLWSSYLIVERTPRIDPTRILLMLSDSPWSEHAIRFTLKQDIRPALQWLADTPAAMLMLYFKLPAEQYDALLAAVNELYFVKQDCAYNTPAASTR